MKKQITSLFVALTMVVMVSVFSSTQAQRWAGGDGMPVVNPNSGYDFSDGGPVFCYYPSTGFVTINALGPNSAVDSADNLTLLGDDFGIILFTLSMPIDPGTGLVATLPAAADGIAWSAPVWFNGKVVLSGNAVGASFLPVALETALFQLPAGLKVDDFRGSGGNVEIEAGVNFNFNQPGSTLFSVGDARIRRFRIPYFGRTPLPRPRTDFDSAGRHRPAKYAWHRSTTKELATYTLG